MTSSTLPSRTYYRGALAPHPAPPVDELCPICLEPFQSASSTELRLRRCKNPVVQLRLCKHTFHYKCITTWFRSRHNTCPQCRAQLFDLNAEISRPNSNPAFGPVHAAWYPGRRADSGRAEQPIGGFMTERDRRHRIVRQGPLGDTRYIVSRPDRPRATFQEDNHTSWRCRVAIFYRIVGGIPITYSVTHTPYTTTLTLFDFVGQTAQFTFCYSSELRHPEDYFQPSWFREHIAKRPADDYFEPGLFEQSVTNDLYPSQKNSLN